MFVYKVLVVVFIQICNISCLENLLHLNVCMDFKFDEWQSTIVFVYHYLSKYVYILISIIFTFLFCHNHLHTYIYDEKIASVGNF